MIKRIIDVSNPSYLHMRDYQMIVEQKKNEIERVPIEDMGVLILSNPAITISSSLISSCQQNNCIIVFCDRKHLPVSILLPLSGNSMHSKILNIQTGVKKPTKKRLWQKIVVAKIESQAKALLSCGKNSSAIESMKSRVKSGDPDNVESQASRVYWPLMFGKDFRRDQKAEGTNSLLNYGYALLRASVARAICGTGLHPALGIHHHNQYNPMCLADDLMEPFRPVVDRRVYRLWEEEMSGINKRTKSFLLSFLSESLVFKEKKLPFMVALQYTAASLKKALTEGPESLEIPSLIIKEQQEMFLI